MMALVIILCELVYATRRNVQIRVTSRMGHLLVDGVVIER
jgi:hypothetical protein